MRVAVSILLGRSRFGVPPPAVGDIEGFVSSLRDSANAIPVWQIRADLLFYPFRKDESAICIFTHTVLKIQGLRGDSNSSHRVLFLTSVMMLNSSLWLARHRSPPGPPQVCISVQTSFWGLNMRYGIPGEVNGVLPSRKCLRQLRRTALTQHTPPCPFRECQR